MELMQFFDSISGYSCHKNTPSDNLETDHSEHHGRKTQQSQHSEY